MPKEVGWFHPAATHRRIGVMPKTKLVQQTEDVLVDTRGNIYITDKQWGLFVLRLHRQRRTRAGGPVAKARKFFCTMRRFRRPKSKKYENI